VIPLLLLLAVVKLPPASVPELAQAPDPPRTGTHVQARREHDGSPLLFESLQATAPFAAAPAAGAGFVSGSSTAVYPADAAGAVGPRHVVALTNAGIVVQDRAGSTIAKASLAQFWSDPALPGSQSYDPRILYDAKSDRWIAVSLFDVGFKSSTLLLGVSQSGDPAGLWDRYRIPVNAPRDAAADFTRLGMSADRILITANVRADTYVWTAMKSQLYAGTADVAKRQVAGLTDLQPVTDDTSQTAFLIGNGDSNLELYRLGFTAETLGVFRRDGWSSPGDPEIAPQLGSGIPMDVGDTVVQAAVGRGGIAWAVHPIVLYDPAPRSAIRWWKVALDGSHADSGTIDDPTGAQWYGFPSVAVNRDGGALIGYCVYRTDIHPSIGYAYVDRNGAASAPAIARYGDYVPAQPRWGDYTTTMVDPANDSDFWIIAPFAGSSMWSTWWTQVRVQTQPARGRAVRH
jgi:hypothetical protein